MRTLAVLLLVRLALPLDHFSCCRGRPRRHSHDSPHLVAGFEATVGIGRPLDSRSTIADCTVVGGHRQKKPSDEALSTVSYAKQGWCCSYPAFGVPDANCVLPDRRLSVATANACPPRQRVVPPRKESQPTSSPTASTASTRMGCPRTATPRSQAMITSNSELARSLPAGGK